MRQMSFIESIKSVFNKYATFHGRARRSEFWWFALLCYIIQYAVGGVMSIVLLTMMTAIADIDNPSSEFATGILIFLFVACSIMSIISLVLLLPSLSVSVRRLHDIGKSGWNLLLAIIPIAGHIVLLIWFCTDSQPGENKWGTNPKETAKNDGNTAT